MNTKDDGQNAVESKLIAREELIYNLTEDLLVLLEDKGVTKAELAKKLGKSRSYVTQLLSGNRNMTLGTLSDICYELRAKPVVRILPNGAKVLAYEQEPTWQEAQLPEIVNVSNSVVSFYEVKETIEYHRLSEAVGC